MNYQATPGRGGAAADHEASPSRQADTALEEIAEVELGQRSFKPPSTLRPWCERLRTIAAVSTGGFLGANARFLVSLWAAERWGTALPWGTLLVNISGSFVLGFFLTLVAGRFVGWSAMRLFVATGFLGAFTTFSTLSYEVVGLLESDTSLVALAYVVASLVLGLAAAIAGIVCADAI